MKHLLLSGFVLFAAFDVQAVAVAKANYMFHWGSENRIKMLSRYKELDKKAFTIAGFGKKNGIVYGEGFYVSNKVLKWSHLGEDLMIVKVPQDKNFGVKRLEEGNFDDLRFTQEDPRIKLLSFDEGLKDMLESGDKQWIQSKENFESLLLAIFKSKNMKALSYLNSLRTSPMLSSKARELFELYLPNSKWAFEALSKRHGVYATFAKPITPDAQQYFMNGLWPMMRIRSGLTKQIAGTELDKETHKRWLYGIEMVNEGSPLPLTVQDIKDIHATISPVPSEVRTAYSNQVEQIQAPDLRSKALGFAKQENWNEFRSLLNLPAPPVSFRTDGLVLTRPPGFEYSGQTLFSEQQVYRLMENPNFEVQVESSNSQGVKARIIFAPNQNLEAEVTQLVAAMNLKVKNLKSRSDLKPAVMIDQAIQIASDFYWELVSRQVFPNESNRTARLARDWVLQNFGLPAPAYTLSNELELTKAELKHETEKAMIETVRIFGAGAPEIDGAVKNLRKQPPGRLAAPIRSCEQLF